MTTHSERRVVPYSPEQMYRLVSTVEKYPEFLPWCTAAKVYSRDDKGFLADVTVGFKGMSQTYTSRVTLTADERVQAAYVKGPFKRLSNDWVFRPHPRGCEIEFFVDFEFSSKVLQALVGVVFHEACRHMVGAFEERAKQLYRE